MEKGEGVRDSNFPPKKNQSEAADVATATSMDFPAAKKLARQLDFNTVGGSAPPPASSGRTQAVLPEHHQRPVVVQVQHPTPPPPPQPKQPPLQQQQQPLRPLKPESPKARPRQNVEGKDGTPKKQKQCNCKHSRCLKLYCECFASGRYCDGCNCVNCHNNVDNEPARRGAVESTLERNPDAFRPKVASSPHGNRDNREEAGILAKHNRGCHCKKSGCLKKYCECFQANILCSENCRCMDCKNFEGSEERQALFHGDSANNIAYLQQAANAAITGAIGTSGYGSPPVYRKRKAQELSFGGPAAKDLSFDGLAQFQQTNHVKACGPSSSVPGARVATNAPPMGPVKFTYRSLLADLIRTDDMKELCAVLVVYASEAARLHTEERIAKEKMKANNTESSLTSSVTDQQQSPKESDAMKAVADESSSGVQAEGSGSEDAEGSKTRPMSPGTLALMCDEEDTVFLNSGSNGLLDHGVDNDNRLPNGQVITEAYGEQEKTVLTTFRDCLNKLITLGELKETKCASLARSDCGGQSQSNDNHENLKSPFNLKNGDLKQKHEKDM